MSQEPCAAAVIAGKLRLLRPLGQGGMGVVWAARHETLDTDVAVKLIRPERVAADPTLVARFELEARTTARLAHPHVVHVMDFGTFDGLPYIVMELLDGFSLADLLQSGGRLSFSSAAVLLEQVGSALACAHERGVVHRDIKPSNLFILLAVATLPFLLLPGEAGRLLGAAPRLRFALLAGSLFTQPRALGVFLLDAFLLEPLKLGEREGDGGLGATGGHR